jgi:transmembrane sensor
MTTPDRSKIAAQEQAESEAAAWLARRDAGWNEQEHAEFERWLAGDALHAAAWRDLQLAWTAFDRPRRLGVSEAMVKALHARSRRRWRLRVGTATATIAAAAAVWLFVSRPTLPSSGGTPVAAAPVIYHVERRVLPDESVVELNLGAQIEVSYLPDRRAVRLVNGEALFTVTKNPARPFVVTAGSLLVRAVGTAFSVRLGPESTDVLVTEGKVSADRAKDGPGMQEGARGCAEHSHVMVPAGSFLAVPATDSKAAGSALAVTTLPAAEIEQKLEWRRPRVELSGTPLRAAVEVFNREAHAHLMVDDPELAALRLSGVFRADNADGFVRLLQSNYGVKVEIRGGETRLRLTR